jgi:hypothetical protein
MSVVMVMPMTVVAMMVVMAAIGKRGVWRTGADQQRAGSRQRQCDFLEHDALLVKAVNAISGSDANCRSAAEGFCLNYLLSRSLGH